MLQWLPRTRTEDEVAESLDGAFEQAQEPVVAFLAGLGERMPSDTVPNSGDANWWLHKVGEAAGNRELRRTDPALFLESEGSHAADWFLGVRQRDGKNVHLGHTHDRPMENFSAGQRRWMDEALATVSRELRARGERAELFTSVLDQVDDDTLVEHLVPGTELAESEGYWLGEALDATYSSLEPVLVEIASARDPKEPARHAFVRAVLPYFAQLDQQLVVRVFDEPEAHLHVTAQRRVASAVQSLRHEEAERRRGHALSGLPRVRGLADRAPQRRCAHGCDPDGPQRAPPGDPRAGPHPRRVAVRRRWDPGRGRTA